jgi:ABC-type nitrate/sulfonate/bicarbonate transport system substrate-binding protein
MRAIGLMERGERRSFMARLPAVLRVLVLVLPVVSLAVAPPAAAQTRATLSAVVIGVSVSIWPAIVADQKGLFTEEGLDFDLINSGSSTRSLQQVAAGSASIGSSSMVDSIRAIGGGANVKIFLNSLAVGTHSLVAAKNIKSVRDLKGKRVMTGGQGDITNLWWYAVAKHFGLDPSRDVELLFSGSTTARTAVLLGGAIDASVLSTPQSFKAIEDGFTDLGPVAPYLGEFPMMIWHVNAAWARTNEKTLAGFIRAHNKAVRYLSDPAHKREVAEILAKASGSGLDDALKTWDLCMQINAFVPDGSITDAAILRARDALLESGDLARPAMPPAAYYDRHLVDAVVR